MAVGNNLTNGDTAILDAPFDFYLDGSAFWGNFAQVISNGYALYWSKTASVNANAYGLYYYGSALVPTISNQRNNGWFVRCENLPLIFSPEAMGWPWEVRRTGTRHYLAF